MQVLDQMAQQDRRIPPADIYQGRILAAHIRQPLALLEGTGQGFRPAPGLRPGLAGLDRLAAEHQLQGAPLGQGFPGQAFQGKFPKMHPTARIEGQGEQFLQAQLQHHRILHGIGAAGGSGLGCRGMGR